MNSADEEVPYLSPYSQELPENSEVPVQDEADFSTLKQVKKTLEQYIAGLGKEFNAFDVLKAVDPDIAAKDLVVQIRAKQEVHALLSNLVTFIGGSIDAIDFKNSNKRKR